MSESNLTDFEKTSIWLQKVILPKFFEDYRNELGDDTFIAKLQDRIDTWQREKRRQDQCKIIVAYQNLDIVVKVDNEVICTFTG